MDYRIDNFTLNFPVVIVFFIFIMLFFNYRSILNKINNNIKYIILLNRSLLLLFLLLIFINPVILKKNVNKQNLSFIFDNSKSMMHNYQDLNVDYKLLHNKIISWVKYKNITPKFYIFGEQYMQIPNLNQIDYSGTFTDMSAMIKYAENNSIIIISNWISRHIITRT